MIEFEDEIIVIDELKIVDGGHKHDLCDGEFFNPISISFDT